MSTSVFSRKRFLGLASMAAFGAGAAAVHARSHQTDIELRDHYTAIVVGSGYGGGVSALRLGQAGIDTLILEKGRHWTTPDEDGKRFSKMLPADTRSGWFTPIPPSLTTSFRGITVADVAQNVPSPQPVQAGICDKSTHGSHDVFRGICVGGGSMVNAAIAAIPTAAQVSAAFPDIAPTEFLGTYIDRARRSLRISYRNMDWFEQTPWFQYSRVGRQYAAAAGYPVDYNGSAYSFDYLMEETAGRVPPSATAFEQQYGNNFGRIGNVADTYIKAAMDTGSVSLKPLTEVTNIRREPSGEYVVQIRTIDRWGKQLALHEIGCQHLYLSAGVLGTNHILIRARDTGALPNLSEAIGRGYGNNGDVMVAHMLSNQNPAGTQQSLMGMINLDGRADPDNPVYASTFSIPLPEETFMLGYYAMVNTTDRADISYDRQSDSISIQWTDDHTQHLVERAKSVFDRVVNANRVDYRDDIFSGKVFTPNTVHPLGGCIRGQVTDEFGRVIGYDNLYINDASLVPGFLGCNPFMTITALAERNIEAILQGRGRTTA